MFWLPPVGLLKLWPLLCWEWHPLSIQVRNCKCQQLFYYMELSMKGNEVNLISRLFLYLQPTLQKRPQSYQAEERTNHMLKNFQTQQRQWMVLGSLRLKVSSNYRSSIKSLFQFVFPRKSDNPTVHDLIRSHLLRNLHLNCLNLWVVMYTSKL